jgi:hypothetical protein
MLFGLRRSWEAADFREEPSGYGAHKFLEMAESSLLKVVTYIHLCQRTAELAPEAAQRGLSLLDHAALLVRGLIRNT